MIAVLADDLTGAAEMGGLGWRHALAAEILHRGEPPADSKLLVYDSDSRHCSAAEARRRVRRILGRLQPRRPEWLFKKVDSVLRGHVLAEIETALKILGLNRAILVPANPAAGRVIRDGNYFIHDRLIHETDFRNDPRHPRLFAQVSELIGRSRNLSPVVLNLKAKLPDHGLIVGEAATVADVRAWAERVDDQTLAVGGAEFFRSLLLKNGCQQRVEKDALRQSPGTRTLFVCGSLSDTAASFLQQCRSKGWPVLLMPDTLLSDKRRTRSLRQKWVQQIIAALKEHPQVVMGIGQPAGAGLHSAARLGALLTGAARRVLTEARPEYAGVEGGATAALLTEKLGWRRLSIEREYATGVVGVSWPECPGLVLVAKPGSYAWPPDLLI